MTSTSAHHFTNPPLTSHLSPITIHQSTNPPITNNHSPITNLPITNNHSPITTHQSTTHHSPSTAHQSTNLSLTNPPIFISQDPELNASVARYFKYIHNTIITTILLPISHQSNTNLPITPHQSPIYQSTNHHSTTHHSPLYQSTNNHSPIIIFNEISVDGDICSFYPFWFTYGLRNQIRVYAFTIGMTDFSCNLVNWEDFLNLSWLEKFNSSIDFNRVSYFDNTRGHLAGILKPHGGESLYDLAAGFHMTFANASQYVARIKTSGKKVPANFLSDIIEPGTARFREFLKKEPRHHAFLSMLPEAELLFAAIKGLGSLIDELVGVGIKGIDSLETLSRILLLIEMQTSFIHSFFLNLETFLQRGPQ